jgi:NADH-quinone oxidoreductase subunit J
MDQVLFTISGYDLTPARILFYVLSWGMLTAALSVIVNRNPINSAISLVLVFFCMACLFVLLEAFFLAAVQILVYAGAIMVLFLFVIMLLNVAQEEKRKWNIFGVVGGSLVGCFILFELVIFLIVKQQKIIDMTSPEVGVLGTTRAVGRLLFTRYLLPFEIASVLLLVAMIGVIILTKKERS